MENYKVAEAMKMCAETHMNQRDKAGIPYVMHTMRVAANFTDPQLVIIALLHDVLEDSASIKAKYIQSAFGKDILGVVQTLTRIKGEDYIDYIVRIKRDVVATKIKLADLRDNMNVIRLKYIMKEDAVRLNKYKDAYIILNS